LWRQDGRELYFMTALGQVMAVDVEPGDAFRVSVVRELFRADVRTLTLFARSYAAFPDGQRFVADVLREGDPRQLTLVTDWRSGPGR
jgi:hypothetical protein